MKILLVLIDKEIRQFWRNRFLPVMTIVFPILVMLIFPWITTMEVRNVGVVVVDGDRSSASRRLVSKIGASDNFSLLGTAPDFNSALAALEAGEADIIVEIPDGFGEIRAEEHRNVSISANGVNAVKGALGTQYMLQTVMRTQAELLGEKMPFSPADDIAVLNLYNPTLEYRFYMIPALMIILMIMLGGFLPALNLVIEKEKGTIEQINVSPVGRLPFTLAKLIPFWIIVLAVLSVAMLIARFVYGLTIAGSAGAIYSASVLFVLAMSGLGVTVANHSSTMQQTMFEMFFFVVIFVLMSGLITPVESMPEWAQWITRLLPPRYFVDIMRAVYLKGTTVAELWREYLALGGFALLFDTLAVVAYKKQA